MTLFILNGTTDVGGYDGGYSVAAATLTLISVNISSLGLDKYLLTSYLHQTRQKRFA